MNMGRSIALAAIAALLPGLAAAAAPLSYLQTFGPAGDPVTHLGWGLGIISLVVLAIVSIALLGGILRRRSRTQRAGELAVRSDTGGVSWIYVGVSISAVVLAGCALWTMFTLRAIAMPSHANELTLQVSAAQWWWRVRYADPQSQSVFWTANEIHVPVGRPVKVELSSEDVIHSFWVPQLAGKIDVIPGQTNVLWLQAAKPGVYLGECGEFCGAQHAHMQMRVIADEPKDYAAWRENQVRAVADAAPAAAAHGASLVAARCGACHTVRGTGAGGILGPDLTHLMTRGTIAAGLLPNTPGNLAAWIANPQTLKPGSRMPAPQLSPSELQSVIAYLETLH
jgi:cytochrome c oxidase subunit II